MKRPFFPPFLVAFPILSLFSANVNIVALGELVRPLLLALAALLLIWLLARLAFKSWIQSGIFASFVVVAFLEFGQVIDPLQPSGASVFVSVLYGLTALAVAVLLARRIKSPEIWNVVSLAAVVVASLSAVVSYAQSNATIGSLRNGHSGSVVATRAPRPDIFYIILDGYGRSDAVKRAIGYDNSAFIDSLKTSGFFVADQSRSNYCQTELSLSSSLNMDYLQNILPPGHESDQERLVFQHLIAENRVETELTKLGYATIAITTGFPSVQFPNAAVHAQTSGNRLTLFESAIFEETPMRFSRTVASSMFDRRRDDLYSALATLKKMGGAAGKPRFVVAHVLAPHPPFVVTATGNPIRPHGPFSYFDGSHYMEFVGTRETYAAGYSAQAQYVSGQILDIVQHLTEGRSVPPIVIVQGDHGSKRYLDQDNLEKTDLKECFPNLNAYLVPEEIRSKLYPGITPVNSFRLILGYVGVPDLPLLPDKTYWSGFGLPQKFVDVSDRSQLHSGDPNPSGRLSGT